MSGSPMGVYGKPSDKLDPIKIEHGKAAQLILTFDDSTSDTRLHFGLGSESTMNKIEVFWPSGLRQEFHDVLADAVYEIKEGEPVRKIAQLPAL